MHKNVILVAETGSDITPEQAAQYGIYLAPMHVQLGTVTKDDGTFPAEEVCEYYDKTGDVPRTSGCTPEDFNVVFDQIHARWPQHKILYLAYSAVTTCSYHSAELAAEEWDYVVAVDTKQVSVGQAAVVLQLAKLLQHNPDMTVEQAAEEARKIMARTRMAFIPQNLDYLRAGGRVSNAAAMVGNLLGLHPCIEVENGYLLAKKKYRGAMKKVIPALIRDHMEKYALSTDHLYFIWAPGFGDELRQAAEQTAKELGVQQVTWMKTGCVITCHGGVGAFGIVGMEQ
ncbi:MAG: DegV family EDD domain-containing protein [Faecalibacterium sp.]|nr:DegV family EDD domain-containing protein [Faecalibacterium sp.]